MDGLLVFDRLNRWGSPLSVPWEPGRLGSTAQCSTSGTCQALPIPSWSNLKQRRLGKITHSMKDSEYLVDQVSVIGSVEFKGSQQEVIEWRAPSRQQQLSEYEKDAVNEIEVQKNPLSDRELELAENKTSVSGLRSEGRIFEESTRSEEGQNAKRIRQGWRRLVSEQDIRKQGNSKAYLLRKPRRTRTGKLRFNGADYSPREEIGVFSGNRDPILERLLKSLASRDKGSAVQRYFGRELDERMAVSKEETTSASKAVGEGLTSGDSVRSGNSDDRESYPVRSKGTEGAGRLGINLDLDLYRSRCLVEEGRLEEAERILRECIRDWPDDGRPFLALGLLASPPSKAQTNAGDKDLGAERNEMNVAATAIERAVTANNLVSLDGLDREGIESRTVPRSPAVSEKGERLKINLDLQLYQAKCLRQRGRPDLAEAILRKCIRDWPDDGRPYVILGKQLSGQNRTQEARTLYDSGCQAVRGENPYIWQAWAVLEGKAGDVAKARKLFDAAIVADKTHVAAWHGWAMLELRFGNVKRARSLLNKGLKFGGLNEYVLQTLALLEFRDRKVEQARSLLSRAVQHSPNSAPSWLAWALIESENNLRDSARRLFQRAIEASPRNRYVWQAWALFEAKQGNEEWARAFFQTGHELNPGDAVLLQAFALFEFKCGRPWIARDLFRRALACDPKHQPVWIAWGWMEWKEQNISVARELYQGAIQVDSRSLDAARALQAWGVLEDREGESGTARELFKYALKIDSQNVPAWMSWAAMEDRQGRSVRADEIRNQFLQQRTEVVEGVQWDVDFADLLAPAIERIRGLFKVNKQPGSARSEMTYSASTDLTARPSREEETEELEMDALGPSVATYSGEQEFDLDRFLREKFPWKYGSRGSLRSRGWKATQTLSGE